MTPNQPQSGSSKLPTITIVVLVAMIIALLYIGYDKLSDTTGNTDDLTNIPLDTAQRSLAMQGQPELIAPVDSLADTSATPSPVDLSQEEPPVEPTVTDKSKDKTPEDDEASDEKPVAEKPKPAVTEEKPTPVPDEKKPEMPKSGGTTTTYTVGSGETFYGIASRLNMKLTTLKALNPNVSEADVKAGVTKLNVKVRAVHTVGAGDVLRVVAEKYGVSKEALMKANGKTKDFAQRGERLIIPFAEKQ